MLNHQLATQIVEELWKHLPEIRNMIEDDDMPQAFAEQVQVVEDVLDGS